MPFPNEVLINYTDGLKLIEQSKKSPLQQRRSHRHEGIDLLSQSADAGYAPAQFELAKLYRTHALDHLGKLATTGLENAESTVIEPTQAAIALFRAAAQQASAREAYAPIEHVMIFAAHLIQNGQGPAVFHTRLVETVYQALSQPLDIKPFREDALQRLAPSALTNG